MMDAVTTVHVSFGMPVSCESMCVKTSSHCRTDVFPAVVRAIVVLLYSRARWHAPPDCGRGPQQVLLTASEGRPEENDMD